MSREPRVREILLGAAVVSSVFGFIAGMLGWPQWVTLPISAGVAGLAAASLWPRQ